MHRIAVFLVLFMGLCPAGALAGDRANRAVVVVVIGDSLADGLWGSLYRTYVRFRDVRIVRETRNSAGFTNYDWQRRLRGILERHPSIDAAVIQLGANDRQWIRADRGDRPLFGSARWQTVYRQRVEAMMQALAERRIPVFWVGLPIMRDRKARDAALLMNRIFREAAASRGAIFVPTWSATANEAGEYIAFIRDRRGRLLRLRHTDGIHSSPIGYDRAGREVIEALRRQLADMPPARR